MVAKLGGDSDFGETLWNPLKEILRTSSLSMVPRLSGLAKQALSLHRALLRAARVKPEEARVAIVSRIRAEFEGRRALDPMRDMQQIEHFIRAGRKQLERLRDPNVKAVAGSG